MNPIAAIEKLINEHGSAAILKERLALAADQFSHLEGKLAALTERLDQSESDNADLKAQKAKLESKVKQLEKQLNALRPSVGGFVEHHGVLWRREQDGFEPRPYCPHCKHHPVMMSFGPWWTCPTGDHNFDSKLRPPKIEA